MRTNPVTATSRIHSLQLTIMSAALLTGFALISNAQNEKPDTGDSKEFVGTTRRAPVPVLTNAATGKVVGKLDYVESITRKDLASVNWVEFSRDGRFLYATAWSLGSINVFEYDAATGKLKHVQNFTDPKLLAGCTGLAISPNGTFAVAAAFQAQNAVLFGRDAKSGKLKQMDFKHQGADGVQGLSFPVHVAISPDSKFAYLADSGNGPKGNATTFEILASGKLRFVESNSGENGCFINLRGITMHPNGKWIATAAAGGGALTMLERDSKTGKTRVLQVLRGAEEEGKGTSLAGVMQTAFSADGKFLYVSAGRFNGESAIRAYQVEPNGNLILLQQLTAGSSHLEDFNGGNAIAVSPDGLSVYVAATKSGALAWLRRHPPTGRIAASETILPNDQSLAGAAGVAVSADGKLVCVAVENRGSLAIFKRQTK